MAKKPIRSGFCENGYHEGLRPKNWRGNPLPTCIWEHCHCECHAKIDAMFKIAEVDRVGRMPNPEYVPDHGGFLPPKQADLRVDSSPTDTSHPGPIAGPQTGTSGVLDPVAGRAFDLTPTGQRARGQLEYEVLAICRQFDDKVYDWDLCLPKYIAEAIDKNDPPSVGAVNAVFERWVKMEFALIGKKPTRFVGFTNNSGTPEELDQLKLKIKRNRTRIKSDQKRGYRR